MTLFNDKEVEISSTEPLVIEKYTLAFSRPKASDSSFLRKGPFSKLV